ncbi:MAG: SLC13 family permease, partial [Chitinophagales bacterium]
NIMVELILPSIVSLLIPLLYQSYFMKGSVKRVVSPENKWPASAPFSNTIFFLGVGSLISVPIFKTITHLPPYMGILLALGILWIITELLHAGTEERRHLRVSNVLSRIDLTSILFFLGILLAVAGLESVGLLNATAQWLDTTVGNKDVIITILGMLSAVIDNVPMVAASMGMYSLNEFPADDKIWEMIAFCTGTGGSILIIGSAAGVVVMGMEKIDFIWYLKNISVTALLGYFAGIFTYLLMYALFHV